MLDSFPSWSAASRPGSSCLECSRCRGGTCRKFPNTFSPTPSWTNFSPHRVWSPSSSNLNQWCWWLYFRSLCFRPVYRADARKTCRLFSDCFQKSKFIRDEFYIEPEEVPELFVEVVFLPKRSDFAHSHFFLVLGFVKQLGLIFFHIAVEEVTVIFC